MGYRQRRDSDAAGSRYVGLQPPDFGRISGQPPMPVRRRPPPRPRRSHDRRPGACPAVFGQQILRIEQMQLGLSAVEG